MRRVLLVLLSVTVSITLPVVAFRLGQTLTYLPLDAAEALAQHPTLENTTNVQAAYAAWTGKASLVSRSMVAIGAVEAYFHLVMLSFMEEDYGTSKRYPVVPPKKASAGTTHSQPSDIPLSNLRPPEASGNSTAPDGSSHLQSSSKGQLARTFQAHEQLRENQDAGEMEARGLNRIGHDARSQVSILL